MPVTTRKGTTKPGLDLTKLDKLASKGTVTPQAPAPQGLAPSPPPVPAPPTPNLGTGQAPGFAPLVAGAAGLSDTGKAPATARTQTAAAGTTPPAGGQPNLMEFLVGIPAAIGEGLGNLFGGPKPELGPFQDGNQGVLGQTPAERRERERQVFEFRQANARRPGGAATAQPDGVSQFDRPGDLPDEFQLTEGIGTFGDATAATEPSLTGLGPLAALPGSEFPMFVGSETGSGQLAVISPMTGAVLSLSDENVKALVPKRRIGPDGQLTDSFYWGFKDVDLFNADPNSERVQYELSQQFDDVQQLWLAKFGGDRNFDIEGQGGGLTGDPQMDALLNAFLGIGQGQGGGQAAAPEPSPEQVPEVASSTTAAGLDPDLLNGLDPNMLMQLILAMLARGGMGPVPGAT